MTVKGSIYIHIQIYTAVRSLAEMTKNYLQNCDHVGLWCDILASGHQMHVESIDKDIHLSPG